MNFINFQIKCNQEEKSSCPVMSKRFFLLFSFHYKTKTITMRFEDDLRSRIRVSFQSSLNAKGDFSVT